MRMAVADRVMAVVFLALGLALLVGGYTMDRLEIRRIHPASIPGLVPMILGVLLAICAVLLYRAAYTGEQGEGATIPAGSWSRLAITAVITIVYAVLLVGWLPYFWATFLFVLVFALVFSFPVGGAARARLIALFGSGVLAVAVAAGSALLFQELFLVRLP